MLKFRIWLDNEKKMVTCADYVIASDGTVYETGYYDGCDLVREAENTYVMRNTEYVYEQGSGCVADKYIFELDIVYCGNHDTENDHRYWVDLGIIFYDDCDYNFQVFFPYTGKAEDLHDLGIDLVSHYFMIRDDPKYKDFIESIPDVIRPDR